MATGALLKILFSNRNTKRALHRRRMHMMPPQFTVMLNMGAGPGGKHILPLPPVTGAAKLDVHGIGHRGKCVQNLSGFQRGKEHSELEQAAWRVPRP